MLVVRRDRFEQVFQGLHAGHTVDELELPLRFVILAGIIENRGSYRFVYSARNVEWDARILESPRPGVLVVSPEHLPWLTQDPPDAVEEHSLAIREVEQNVLD